MTEMPNAGPPPEQIAAQRRLAAACRAVVRQEIFAVHRHAHLKPTIFEQWLFGYARIWKQTTHLHPAAMIAQNVEGIEDARRFIEATA